MATSNLPQYDYPPVTEVVCGVLFATLNAFRLPHFGLFWEKIKADFPTCQEVAPLMPLIEAFGVEQETPVSLSEMPLPRVWFVHRDDAAIVQVQRDRFLSNWKRISPTEPYVRYPTVIKLFKERLNSFESFLKENSLGAIDPLQYEMTYVNHIIEGEGWSNASDLGKVFRDHQWHGKENRFLPGIEHLNLRTSFVLPNNAGRLHVSIRDGKRREDMKSIILFELTVRGFPPDNSLAAMWDWFDVAREWIVRGFTDLTTEEVQNNIWGRTR